MSNSQGGGSTLGFSYLPGTQSASWDAWKDGIVVDFQNFGSILQAASSDGRTPTHEVGHYLGLQHTFAEGNGLPWNNPCIDSQGNIQCCDNDNWGGVIDDTPACFDVNNGGPYFGNVTASTHNNTCDDTQYANAFTSNVLDMDENYMSYAANTWMFTHKQIDVMRYTLNQSWSNGGRSELKNSDGCMIVGIIDILNNKLISIHPNPTNGIINFKFAMDDNMKMISIQNVLGEEIYTSMQIQNDIFTLDLSAFPKGIYFAIIDTDKGRTIEKILLSK